MNEAWQRMLLSVEKRRDRDARFFKPTCLLAVIDGIDDASLSPSDLDAEKVVARFSSYLSEILPDRADSGWRPFWHLSRDGAWAFSKAGRIVGPENFRTQRKPNSRRELMTKIDHVFVPSAERIFWLDPAARRELRASVIAMLEADDADCRLVAAHLRQFQHDPDFIPMMGVPSPTGGATDRTASQGFLSSPLIRKGIEDRAMLIAIALLEQDRWRVEDVSARRSYDLYCTRGDQVRYVEVKGTTGLGEQILLTANEVAFAHGHRENMILIIVSNIAVELDAAGSVVATGGIARLLEGWAPDAAALRPITFSCDVGATKGG
jgi:hypothetical protein